MTHLVRLFHRNTILSRALSSLISRLSSLVSPAKDGEAGIELDAQQEVIPHEDVQQRPRQQHWQHTQNNTTAVIGAEKT